MAITELQLPSKTDLYTIVQNVAGEISQSMHRWSQVAEFLSRMGTADLDAASIPTGQVRADLVDFRLLLAELNAYWGNAAVTPANDPQEIVNTLRKINHG